MQSPAMMNIPKTGKYSVRGLGTLNQFRTKYYTICQQKNPSVTGSFASSSQLLYDHGMLMSPSCKSQLLM